MKASVLSILALLLCLLQTNAITLKELHSSLHMPSTLKKSSCFTVLDDIKILIQENPETKKATEKIIELMSSSEENGHKNKKELESEVKKQQEIIAKNSLFKKKLEEMEKVCKDVSSSDAEEYNSFLK